MSSGEVRDLHVRFTSLEGTAITVTVAALQGLAALPDVNPADNTTTSTVYLG